MKKILIVAYYFPPMQSGGVYRPLKFVKYLREYGWEPIVLTIDAVCAYPKDDGLLKDIPENIIVERTTQVDFYRLVNVVKRKTSVEHVDVANTVGGGGRGRKNKKKYFNVKKYLSKAKRQLPVFLNDVFFIPDNEVPWLPVGTRSAIKLARREHVDVLMTTSPPHSAHLVGLLVKRIMGIPWVVDFRDLWIDEFDFYPKPFGKWRKPVEKILERMVIKHADRVINVSQGESLCLQAEYNHLPAEKFSVIHNGFDTEDFKATSESSCSSQTQNDRLLITYIGTLYPSTADEFFDVLSNLFADYPSIGDQLEIRFIGHIDSSYGEKIANSNFSKSLKILGQKPHDEAIDEMCNSDILLVLLGGQKMKETEVPGKIFEYMGAGKPILALVRPGDVSSILETSNLALTVHPENKSKIKQLLLNCIEQKKRGMLDIEPNYEYINKYSRRELTKKLSKLLDGMIPDD